MSPGAASPLHQGGHGPALAGAAGAVVAQGEVTLEGLAAQLHIHRQYGLGGVAAQAREVAADALDARLALQQPQLALHLGQVEHLALERPQQPGHPATQPGTLGVDPHLHDLPFHHLQAAGRRAGFDEDAAVDVAIGHQPGGEAGGAGLQTLGWIADRQAGREDLAQFGTGIALETADFGQRLAAGAGCAGAGGSWHGGGRDLWLHRQPINLRGRTVPIGSLLGGARPRQPYRPLLNWWGHQLGQQGQSEHESRVKVYEQNLSEICLNFSATDPLVDRPCTTQRSVAGAVAAGSMRAKRFRSFFGR